MPYYPLSPLRVCKVRYLMEFPKEVPFICGHVIVLQAEGWLPGPELVKCLFVVWLHLWLPDLYPLISQGLWVFWGNQDSRSCHDKAERRLSFRGNKGSVSVQICWHHLCLIGFHTDESYLQDPWNPFHFFGFIWKKNVPCTLLSWLSCTNFTLSLLVECIALAFMLGIRVWMVTLGESKSFLPFSSQGCRGLDGHGNKGKQSSHVISPVQLFLDLLNKYQLSAVSRTASDAQRESAGEAGMFLPLKKFNFNT